MLLSLPSVEVKKYCKQSLTLQLDLVSWVTGVTRLAKLWILIVPGGIITITIINYHFNKY